MHSPSSGVPLSITRHCSPPPPPLSPHTTAHHHYNHHSSHCLLHHLSLNTTPSSPVIITPRLAPLLKAPYNTILPLASPPPPPSPSLITTTHQLSSPLPFLTPQRLPFFLIPLPLTPFSHFLFSFFHEPPLNSLLLSPAYCHHLPSLLPLVLVLCLPLCLLRLISSPHLNSFHHHHLPNYHLFLSLFSTSSSRPVQFLSFHIFQPYSSSILAFLFPFLNIIYIFFNYLLRLSTPLLLLSFTNTSFSFPFLA